MRKLLILVAFLAAACTNQQLAKINDSLDRYDQAIKNFNAAVQRIDISIALTSASLAQYCNSAKQVGINLEKVLHGNDAALTALDTVTGGLNEYCSAPPQDVGQAIVKMASIVAAAQAAYKASGG